MSKLIRRRFTGMTAALVVALAIAIPAYAGTIKDLSGQSGQVALIRPAPQTATLGCEVGCAPEAAGPTSQVLQARAHFSVDVNNSVANMGPDVASVPEPGSWMLMATALVLAGGLGLLRLRSAW